MHGKLKKRKEADEHSSEDGVEPKAKRKKRQDTKETEGSKSKKIARSSLKRKRSLTDSEPTESKKMATKTTSAEETVEINSGVTDSSVLIKSKLGDSTKNEADQTEHKAEDPGKEAAGDKSEVKETDKEEKNDKEDEDNEDEKTEKDAENKDKEYDEDRESELYNDQNQDNSEELEQESEQSLSRSRKYSQSSTLFSQFMDAVSSGDSDSVSTYVTTLGQILWTSQEEHMGRFQTEQFVQAINKALKSHFITLDALVDCFIVCINLLDNIPNAVNTFAQHKTIPLLVDKLVTTGGDSDVFLQFLCKFGELNPVAMMKAGTIDFIFGRIAFCDSQAQVRAATLASLVCNRPTPETYDYIKPQLDQFTGLLATSTTFNKNVVELMVSCFTRLTEYFLNDSEKIQTIFQGDLPFTLWTCLSMDGLSIQCQTNVLRTLSLVCRVSPSIYTKLLSFTDIFTTLNHKLEELLTESGKSTSQTKNPQYQLDLLALLNELLPSLPAEINTFFSTSSSMPPSSSRRMPGSLFSSYTPSAEKPEDHVNDPRKEILNSTILENMGGTVLPTLVKIVSSIMNTNLRTKCISVITKLIHFSDSNCLRKVLASINYSAMLAKLLTDKDVGVVAAALYLAENSMEKLNDVFSVYFLREGVVFQVELLSSEAKAYFLDNPFAFPGSPSATSTTATTTPATVESPEQNTAEPPTPTLPTPSTKPPQKSRTEFLKEWISFHSASFLKFFPKASHFSTAYQQLCDLCKKITELVTVQDSDEQTEIRELSKLFQQLADLLTQQSLSAFEMGNSGCVSQLLQSLLYKSSNSDARRQSIRVGLFGRILMTTFTNMPADTQSKGTSNFPTVTATTSTTVTTTVTGITNPISVDHEKRVSALELLVQSVQSLINTEDLFPTFLYPGSITSIKLLADPFKFNLNRDPSETKLYEYTQNHVLIEPLCTVDLIKKFVLTKVLHPPPKPEPVPPPPPISLETFVKKRVYVAPKESTKDQELSLGIEKQKLDETPAGVEDEDTDDTGEITAKTTPSTTKQRTKALKRLKKKEKKQISPPSSPSLESPSSSSFSDSEASKKSSEEKKKEKSKEPEELKEKKIAKREEEAKRLITQLLVPSGKSLWDDAGGDEEEDDDADDSLEPPRFFRETSPAASETKPQLIDITLGPGEKLVLTLNGVKLKEKESAIQIIQRYGQPVPSITSSPLSTGGTGTLFTQPESIRGVGAFGTSVHQLWEPTYNLTYKIEHTPISGSTSTTTTTTTTSSTITATLSNTQSATSVVEEEDSNSTCPEWIGLDHLFDPPVHHSLSKIPKFTLSSVSSPNSKTPVKETSDAITFLWLLHTVYENRASVIDESSDNIFATSNYKLPTRTCTLTDGQTFTNKKLTTKFLRQLQDQLIVCSNAYPEWCEDLATHYKFLLSFDSRLNYFRLCSNGIAKSIKLLFSPGAQTSASSLQPSRSTPTEIRIPRYKVKIDREKILKSAMIVIDNCLKRKNTILEVQYFEEIGHGEGPTKEFYTLVSRELQLSNLQLWIDNRDQKQRQNTSHVFSTAGLFLKPLAFTSDPKETINLCTFLGKFMAKALLDERVIDMPFSAPFFKVLLGQPLTIQDLALVNPDFGRVLLEFSDICRQKKKILDNKDLNNDQQQEQIKSLKYRSKCSVESLDLTFSLSDSDGGTLDLKENGGEIGVTIHNIEEYVTLAANLYLSDGIAEQANAIRTGFDMFFPVSNLKVFTAHELERTLCGIPEDLTQNWTRQELLDNIDSSSDCERILNHLVNVLTSFSIDQRRSFLRFLTGSPRLPVGGWKALNRKFTLSLKKDLYTPDQHLPSVNTCFLRLKLPEYTTEDILREKLIYAMENGHLFVFD